MVGASSKRIGRFMSLSRKTAAKIVDAVAADATCKRAIQTNPAFDLFFAGRCWHSSSRERRGLHEMLRCSSKARIFQTMMLLRKFVSGSRWQLRMQFERPRSRKSRALRQAIENGIEHEATWVRMKDSSQYMVDWHATLRIRDPIISHYDDWQAARGGHALFLVFGVRLIFTARPRTVQPNRVERPCTRVWRRRSYRGLTVLITTDRSLSADGCQDWHALCYLPLRQWQTIAMIFKEEETEMKKFKNIIAVSAFSLMVLALPAIASAQWGNNG